MIISPDSIFRQSMQSIAGTTALLTASSTSSALPRIKTLSPSVILLDLGPSSADTPANRTEGLKDLDRILSCSPRSRVIVIGDMGEQASAALYIGNGAHDCFGSRAEAAELGPIIRQALRLERLEREIMTCQTAGIGNGSLPGILGISPQMEKACQLIRRLAGTSLTVLLLGESGTGKELLARALHEAGPRSGKPFVAVNAAAIPENLMESELFGYEKGAYTGASRLTRGKFELAEGGTFFLDEVGDIPLSLQTKLLRVLQERCLERVGGRRPIPIDVRLVCATHQDIRRLIREGRFREDFYFRINEMVVEIPPLRRRTGDPVFLAGEFLRRYQAGAAPSRPWRLGRAAQEAIEAHDWPGNVRELEHRVKRAVFMAGSQTITPEDLGLSGLEASPEPVMHLEAARRHAERQAIGAALSASRQNISEAARLLGVTRPTLYGIMLRLGIHRPANQATSRPGCGNPVRQDSKVAIP